MLITPVCQASTAKSPIPPCMPVWLFMFHIFYCLHTFSLTHTLAAEERPRSRPRRRIKNRSILSLPHSCYPTIFSLQNFVFFLSLFELIFLLNLSFFCVFTLCSLKFLLEILYCSFTIAVHNLFRFKNIKFLTFKLFLYF